VEVVHPAMIRTDHALGLGNRKIPAEAKKFIRYERFHKAVTRTMSADTTNTPVTTAAKAPAPARKTAAKPVAKPAAKPATKVARKPASKVASKVAPKPAEATAPLKPAKAVKAPKAPKLPKLPKAGKAIKVVRDSFTMPRADFDIIDRIKLRAIEWKQPVKKSEVLRAALHALEGLSDAKLRALLAGLEPIKKGRPSAS
jgi:hypothetical protein